MEGLATNPIATFLGSAVIAALIVFVTKGREERITCIAQERKHWRDELRSITSRIAMLAQKEKDLDETVESLRSLITALETRLNPSDSFDRRIRQKARQLLFQKTKRAHASAVKSSEELTAIQRKTVSRR